MKVAEIRLNHFKRFRDVKIDFRDHETGRPQDIVLLVGNNGSGKTTVLQAIAATVGAVTGQLATPLDLDWTGFEPWLLSPGVDDEPRVEIDLSMSTSELDATARAVTGRSISDLSSSYDIDYIPNDLTIGYASSEHAAWVPEDVNRFLLQGRHYVSNHEGWTQAHRYAFMESVGSIFWYDEQRSSLSLSLDDSSEGAYDMEQLRNMLAIWENYHHRTADLNRESTNGHAQPDVYARLKRAYKRVFPRRTFVGSEPQIGLARTSSKSLFYLFDGKRRYELSEMSAGERAIFPMILDFVRLNINNSIILIDELELHLHPPLQQALLFALPKLGKNNQFIITTHSDDVASMVSPFAIYRVEELGVVKSL